MSAEAADREAATSSRPCTPPQTCWFEFLLEESLLEKHLRKACPGERAGVVRGQGSLGPRRLRPGWRGRAQLDSAPASSVAAQRLRKVSDKGFSVCRGPHSVGRPHPSCSRG